MALYARLATPLRSMGGDSQQLILLRHLTKSDVKCQEILTHSSPLKETTKFDEEWVNAKDYKSIPGPSKLGFLSLFWPGGKLRNANNVEMTQYLREKYGNIYLLKGMFGKDDMVFTFNPDDIALTFRNEGLWPRRQGLESFEYYRRVKRPDVFRGVGGLITDQGKSWADIRNKVNPIMMKIQNVRQNLPQIDAVTNDFIARFSSFHDPKTNLLSTDFHEELKMFAFEAICSIALNTRLGLMTGTADENASKLVQSMSDFFQYSYEYDILPSLWQYFETPGFKRFMQTYDNITNIATNYIDQAISKFEAEGNTEGKSVLERLCRIDKQVALVMAIDMLMAGSDTTSSTLVTILYQLSRNPEKQDALRRELLRIMPTPDTPLTEENTKNMPYLRACLKEGLRKMPIATGNLRVTPKDLVLSGYKVPQGTGVVMDVKTLSSMDQYFARSQEFLPERWLKSGEDACPMAKAKHPFVYLPFGFGPRTCIGKRFAEMEIETFLAKFLRRYKVTWNDPKDLMYKSNTILAPYGNVNFKFEKL